MSTQLMNRQLAGQGAVQMSGVDQLVLDFLNEHNLPGATVAVSKQGRLVWSKGYGYANTEEKLQMQPWHRSRIGSVSKVPTAIGALKLVEDGKLALTTPVYTFYDTSNWHARHGLTGAQYQRTFDQLGRQGFRLVHVSGYEVRGEPRFAAIWEKRNGPEWQARHGMTGAQYQQTFDQLRSQGFRPVQVSGYSVQGQAQFAAIWEKRTDPEWQARHGMTGAQYQQTFDQLRSQGFRPIQVSGYEVNGQARFAAIWERSSGPEWQARHGMTGAQYQQTFDQLRGQGFRPVQVNGYSVRGRARFAAIWDRMASSGPPGALNDKDYTDAMITGVANLHSHLRPPVLPEAQFRAIVATETNKTLMWARDMQIRHLMSHTSGIIGNGDSSKAMEHFNMDQDELTYKETHLAVLLGLRTNGNGKRIPPFGFAPGTDRSYTNHGFGLLGFIIAEVSGIPYDEFIRSRILLPIGLNHVVPYGTSVSSRDAARHRRDANGDPQPLAHGIQDKAMSLALPTGGWAATAQDMVRLMCATDKLRNQSDLLKPGTIDEMETVTFPEVRATQPLGWDSRNAKGKLSKNGRLSGGAALIVKFLPGYKANDGTDLSNVNLAICVNTSHSVKKNNEGKYVPLTNFLPSLLDKIAVECGKADIPASFDLFE
jgi:CubicO group peptidase (beta-lactamase class C family)